MIVFSLVLLVLCFLYVALLVRFSFGVVQLRSISKAGVSADIVSGPHLSVVVAARNEAAVIEKLLKALSAQSYPVSLYEVVIVDDYSSDQTAGRVEAFIRTSDIGNIQLIRAADHRQEHGKKHALALGISHASGSWVVTTDADCSPGPDWLKAIAEHLEHQPADMFIGPVRLAPFKGLFGWFQALEFLSLTGVTAGAAAAGMPLLCSGANLAFRKAVFDEIGGYSSHLKYASGDDVFLLQSFRKRAGIKIDYVKDRRAVVDTLPAPGLKAFFRQRARWVSKSGGYTDWPVITTGLIVAGLNAGLVLGAILCLFSQLFCAPVLMAFLVKVLVDFPLLFASAAFFRQKKLLYLYPFLSLLYPFYVVASLLGGLLRSSKW